MDASGDCPAEVICDSGSLDNPSVFACAAVGLCCMSMQRGEMPNVANEWQPGLNSLLGPQDGGQKLVVVTSVNFLQ